MAEKIMKTKYLINAIIGLTLGCIIVQCKHQRESRRQAEAMSKSRYEVTIKPAQPVQNMIYEYQYTIDNAAEMLELSNFQRVRWRNEEPLRLSKAQIRALNGTYVWQSKINFRTQREMFDYICEHFEEMQKYKVSSSISKRYDRKSSVKEKNIFDDYNDRLDEYLADPEDESEFDPGTFDFLDD